MAHERGGIAKVVMTPASPASPPRIGTTLGIRRIKYSHKELRRLLAAVNIGETSEHHRAPEKPCVTEVDL